VKRSDFTFPPPNESDAPRNDMASICYWLGVGSIWFLPLAAVSIVLGIIALNKIKASQGALSSGIPTFAIVMMSAIIYLGGKYAWGWW
tara:strand:- start:122 stop:385 length:264 start_codon:yes stop_codon:yes gene_type:complete